MLKVGLDIKVILYFFLSQILVYESHLSNKYTTSNTYS